MAIKNVKPLISSNRITAIEFDDATGILTATFANLANGNNEEDFFKETILAFNESSKPRNTGGDIDHPLVKTAIQPNPPYQYFTRGDTTTNELQTEVFSNFNLALKNSDPTNSPAVNDND